MTAAVNLHACAVALAGRGVLIRGPAGSGKSALVLALLRRGAGVEAEFVADDRVIAEPCEGAIKLSAPAEIAGLLEIAGLGIVREPFRPSVPLWLVVDLVPPAAIIRHPPPRTAEILGHLAPLLSLPQRDAALSTDILTTLAISGRLPD
ncbi:HPr kinase/phosphorylase [Jiella avicenniae]|uniref:HPr kinase/phosphatase C-terminal domain-containing protein n=1 Tax=Jiella avicenniae TaxID=2907202 RepID=A0A9X1P2T4_9HYPH|nr:HPr kinase/phosphatase C-terminal domain-containing protein [Jiella avicenniae]MCE7029300.1 HPr kinase/phosphatase C-terminal domain-containing protein [Jiella avicenniae]